MKKSISFLLAPLALVFGLLFVSCNKQMDDSDTVPDNTFSVVKTLWQQGTKASPGTNDIDWEIGDEVTVFSSDGKFHNFTVKDCHGVNAVFDCDDSFWDSHLKYKLFYPSLASGWLEDHGYVLTFSFFPGNDEQKVADWCGSDWERPNKARKMSFVLNHLSSLLELRFNHPHNGKLKECYLRVPDLETDYEHDHTIDYNQFDVFGYKIQYIYKDEDYVLESESKTAFFPLCFEMRDFSKGETMVSTTPIYCGNYSSRRYHLILVYTDGKAFTTLVDVPDAEAGKHYSATVSPNFMELESEPWRWVGW